MGVDDNQDPNPDLFGEKSSDPVGIRVWISIASRERTASSENRGLRGKFRRRTRKLPNSENLLYFCIFLYRLVRSLIHERVEKIGGRKFVNITKADSVL